MVVYKAQNLYENWTQAGPVGIRKYANNASGPPTGAVDMKLFEKWLFKILLPHAIRDSNDTAVLLGDNLASCFSP